MFHDLILFLYEYIRPQEDPRQLLPILAWVIGVCWLLRPTMFLRRGISRQNLEVTQQQLYLQLKNANQRIVFLCMILIFLSAFALAALAAIDGWRCH